MKPSIPEEGIVIRIEDGIAIIMLQAGESCKGCSAGKLGICKPSGNVSIVRARVSEGIKIGDSVRIFLDSVAQSKGMFLTYVVPLISLFTGTYIGYLINTKASIPYMEVITGFASFLIASFITLRRLKKMDSFTRLYAEKIEEPDFSEESKGPEEFRFRATH